MRIGAHVSTAGGVTRAVERAVAIGAETVQIFASSPRAWAYKPIPDDQATAFREAADASGVSPTFLHGIYLMNFGGPPDLLEKSTDALSKHMSAASALGAYGVIFHCGSHKGVGFDGVLDQTTRALTEVLENSPSDVCLIIENSAGMGSHIGSSFQEVGRLIDALAHPAVRVCLDTEHCFAAGYNLADPDGIEAAMDEFDREIGLSRLVAVHANDAKVPLGSGVDRHENIGEGHIGIAGFQTIMGNAAFRDVPFLLEVPGFEKNGPDAENVDRLKTIRQSLGITAG